MLVLVPSPWEQRLTDEFCLNADLRDCYVGVECRETLEEWERPIWNSSNWVVGRTYRTLEQVVSQTAPGGRFNPGGRSASGPPCPTRRGWSKRPRASASARRKSAPWT